jgi:HEPN domain-containing protein
MESVFMREHEHWHSIALEDLESAKHLFLRSFMTTLFHVQQCAEKALKSYNMISFLKN